MPNTSSAANSFPNPIERPLDRAPLRVVSLVPSMTESLFDLDLGDSFSWLCLCHSGWLYPILSGSRLFRTAARGEDRRHNYQETHKRPDLFHLIRPP